MVARSIRYVRRRYGDLSKALKVPISLSTLFRMCSGIPHWPDPALMSHDDRLFLAASTIAITGFLRGGEFLACSKPGHGRPVLLGKQVVGAIRAGDAAVCVSIAQPKTKWWLGDQEVVCHRMPGHILCPVFWMIQYRSRSSVRLSMSSAAFVLSDGRFLSRKWMCARSTELLRLSGCDIRDASGKQVTVKAASWRSGGVQSAKLAGLSDAAIMALGRWTSPAWTSYAFATADDLQSAAFAMAEAAHVSVSSPLSLVVGSFSPSGIFEDESPVSQSGQWWG
jgi:hypothetical protein